MLIDCPHCDERVIAKNGEHCPKCFEQIGKTHDEPSSEIANDTVSQKRRPFSRPWFVKKSIVGIVLGLGLAVFGAVGGSYQSRGAGHVASGNELIWGGVALAVFFGVVFLVCRPWKKSRGHLSE